MPEQKHDPLQWPPPPNTSPKTRGGSGEPQKPTRALTGAAWADSVAGGLISLLSFSLLTFLFFNPIAASLLPEKPSSEIRLLAGWFLGGLTQFTGWKLLRRWSYIQMSEGMVAASFFAGFLWLLIILIACWMFG